MSPRPRLYSQEQLAVFAACLLVLLAAAPSFAQATQSGSSTNNADVHTIVQRMAQAQAESRARRQAYTSTRVYRVYTGQPDAAQQAPKSEIEANINFLPPTQKSYEIAKSTGGMAEHVVRKALDKEVELSKSPEMTELSPSNYDFTWVGEDNWKGNRCLVLSMAPKKDSKDLIKGKVWIDAKSYLVRHVEGSPSKSPSWWVHDVQIALDFDEVQGMWLQTGSTAVAKVRLAGDYVMRSQDTNFRTAETVADDSIGREASGSGLELTRRRAVTRHPARPQQ